MKKTLQIFLAFLCPIMCHAQQIGPAEALQELMKGNQRFVAAQATQPRQTEQRRTETLNIQKPFAVIVSCSDSRVPPEIIFDQGIGDLFVVRVAGNVVGPVELDSIEYAVRILNAPLIMILGHESCGAMKAVLEGEAVSEDIEHIAAFISPMVGYVKKLPGDPVLNLTLENVRQQGEYLRNATNLKSYIQNKKLQIVGGYYYLKSGKVELVTNNN